MLASTGFGGDTRIWGCNEGLWSELGKIIGAILHLTSSWSVRRADEYIDGNKAGEIWAIALSEDGSYFASTTFDGCINVWTTFEDRGKIRKFETKGSFGTSIDLVSRSVRALESRLSLEVTRWSVDCVWTRERRRLHVR